MTGLGSHSKVRKRGGRGAFQTAQFCDFLVFSGGDVDIFLPVIFTAVLVTP